ncbi:MAG: TolC family outer membrane protein [Burkholderiales bacterium]|nr:TolC family outer membrane protein [Burkholderiales bacterium]
MIRIVVMLFALLVAGPVLALDLLDIYREAQANDSRYAAARAQFQSQQERLPQARAGLLPDINFDAAYNYTDVDVDYLDAITFDSGRRDYNAYNYGLSLIQPLYRRQNKLALDQAVVQVAQAATDLDLAGQDLILRAAQAYFDVLLARFNLRAERAQQTAVGEQLEQAKRNFVVGTATITDQREAQARYDLTSARVIAADNDLRVATQALELLTGRPVTEELAGLRAGVEFRPPAPKSIEAWVEQSYATNLEVLRAQQALDIARTEVQRQRAGHQPTLDLVGSISEAYQGSSNFGVGSETTSGIIGVELNLPLYQGGAVNSRTREAIGQQDRATQELESARRSVGQATREAYLGVTLGIAQVGAFEQAVASTELQLESTKLGQEVGVRTAVDVLNAQSQLTLARRDLAQAVYNTLLSQLRLQAAVGRLVEADLLNINELLDTQAQ